jgi:hypothetical protein
LVRLVGRVRLVEAGQATRLVRRVRLVKRVEAGQTTKLVKVIGSLSCFASLKNMIFN